MAYVAIGENENFDSMLRRFNKKVQQSGVISAARRQEHYQKPLTRTKRKAIGKRKEARKATRRRW